MSAVTDRILEIANSEGEQQEDIHRWIMNLVLLRHDDHPMLDEAKTLIQALDPVRNCDELHALHKTLVQQYNAALPQKDPS